MTPRIIQDPDAGTPRCTDHDPTVASSVDHDPEFMIDANS